jgi:hypothetical protein
MNIVCDTGPRGIRLTGKGQTRRQAFVDLIVVDISAIYRYTASIRAVNQ